MELDNQGEDGLVSLAPRVQRGVEAGFHEQPLQLLTALEIVHGTFTPASSSRRAT
jgi:hypothetical protein